MKQLMKKNNIKYLLICIIILAGIIMIAIKGFKFDLSYETTKKVEIYIGKEFDVKDIKAITNETLGNKDVLIEKVEIFKDMVSIKSKDITDEEKNNIVTKINEKYELENKAEEVNVVNVPHTRLKDIYKKYVYPFIISIVIILIYSAIRFRKIGAFKSILKIILTVVLSEATFMSVVALFRIPIGRITTAIILLLYVVSIICIISKLENKLIEKKKKESKDNKIK